MKEFLSAILRYGLYLSLIFLYVVIADANDPEFNSLMKILGLFAWGYFLAKILIPETLRKKKGETDWGEPIS